ncbi:hypothetical protein AWM70_11450 [Paenibacillus yonginensis]|uniref:Transglycosylase SLT domain-containing protein n=1 Tax=Paenibacillus yonginensis TaxID=1462996 RepID=A0A1B1N150_9BACL|nr:lytic transglycosylase domain-containing protein [Paenibacillus yonginensis]ANS75141.1 hypothetical protein AWM70_11450 [Paenibacillus yonginensis]
MQIDPRIVKQLIEYQMMNSIDLTGTTLQGTQNGDTDSFFNQMLQELMAGGSSTDSVSSLANASLSTSSAAGGINLDPGNSQLWYQMISQALSDGGSDLVSSITNDTPATASSVQGSGSSTAYDGLIAEASRKYGVPEALIKAVIDTESSFRPHVESSAGAKGLMQLMDGTARGLGVSDPFDPAQNIDGGVRYLSYQLKRYGGEIKTALAAYNAGPGKVNGLGVSNDAELMDKLHQLPVETQQYIGKIERAMAKYA